MNLREQAKATTPEYQLENKFQQWDHSRILDPILLDRLVASLKASIKVQDTQRDTLEVTLDLVLELQLLLRVQE